MAKKALNQGKRVSPLNQTIGGKKPKVIQGEVKYADAEYIDKDSSKTIADVREKFAPNADKPTSASADKGMQDLPSIMQGIDPDMRAQVIPMMYQKMQQMSSIMSLGSGNGSSNSGGVPSMPSGISVVLEDSFTGSLALLVKVFGFEKVINVFNTALQKGGIDKISSDYQKIVKNTMSNLIKLALFYGPLDIPVSVYDDTIYGDIVPSPLVDTAPDYYVKQYYTLSSDPYPGYVEWISKDGTTKVYTKKPANSYHYNTANEEVFSTSEKNLAKTFGKYLMDNTELVLTGELINQILIDESNNIETNTLNNTMGNNTGSGGGSGSIVGMLQGMLGGQLQSLIQNVQTKQLPNSVLDQGSMGSLLQQKTKDMALNNSIFDISKGMMGSSSPLGSLGNMGGLNNIMSGFGSSGGGIGGVLNNLGGGNLLGNLGSFGGGSSGGGGGAGSGFPTASSGQYSGGNVSNSGLKDINDMLTLLGIS